MNQKLYSIRRICWPHRAAWLTAVFAIGSSSLGQAALTHKYTFNDGTANDSVGGANGTLAAAAGTTAMAPTAIISAGQLDLNNPNFTPSAQPHNWLNLPANILPASGSATIEQWFTFNPSGFFTEAWTFSNSANDTNLPSATNGQYLMHTISNPQPATPPGGANTGGDRIEQALTGYNTEIDAYQTTPNIGVVGGGYLDGGDTYMTATVIDGAAGTLSYYLFDITHGGVGGLQQTIPTTPLSSYSFTNAYLGRSAFLADNATSGKIDEFRVYDDAHTAAQVMSDFQTGPDSLFSLVVNTTTGNVSLKNASALSQSIDYYEIDSAGGKLKPANGSWNSLSDQNIDKFGNNPGQKWDESGNISANALAELFLQGSSTLASGASFNLGNAFNTALGAGDLKLQVSLASGSTITGSVTYISGSADFNGDDHVDGADFVVWQRNLGHTGATLAQGDADGNGTVNAADLAIWKSSFGSVVAATGGVPEPSSCFLAALALAAAMGRGRNSSK